ncbi:MAG: RDD family protein [Candidatus Sericytochromatia bacterium]
MIFRRLFAFIFDIYVYFIIYIIYLISFNNLINKEIIQKNSISDFNYFFIFTIVISLIFTLLENKYHTSFGKKLFKLSVFSNRFIDLFVLNLFKSVFIIFLSLNPIIYYIKYTNLDDYNFYYLLPIIAYLALYLTYLPKKEPILEKTLDIKITNLEISKGNLLIRYFFTTILLLFSIAIFYPSINKLEYNKINTEITNKISEINSEIESYHLKNPDRSYKDIVQEIKLKNKELIYLSDYEKEINKKIFKSSILIDKLGDKFISMRVLDINGNIVKNDKILLD